MLKLSTEKATVRLYKGDKRKLQLYFPALGYNAVVREVVHKLIRQIEEKAGRGQPLVAEIPELDDLNLEGTQPNVE